MGLGYEGWIKLGGDYALGTGTSAPRARSRIESSSGFGGRIKNPVGEIGVGSPYNHDYDLYDGSLDFEMSDDMWTTLRGWMVDRGSSKAVDFSTRDSGLTTIPEAWFTSMSIDASDGSAVTSSVSFLALENTYAYGNEYGVGSPTGIDEICPSWPSAGYIPADPVPYWNTSITIEGTPYEFISWTVSISQDLSRLSVCEGVGSVPAPMYLGIGPMNISFSGIYVLKSTAPDNFVNTLDIDVGGVGQGLRLKGLDLNSWSDDVVSAEEVVAPQYDATAYGFELIV